MSQSDHVQRAQEFVQRWLSHPVLRLVLGVLTVLVISFYVFLDVPLQWQLMSSILFLAMGIVVARFVPGLRNFLILLSITISLRYILWRGTHTLSFEQPIDAVAGIILYMAECYGIVVLVLGYFQTISEYHRKPVPIPSDPALLPSIDFMIPTYNEGVDIVERTAMGALSVDYPNKKVYILDDGRRPQMKVLAAKIGCGYLTRDDNKHAKAGNINAALEKTDGELVAIFDADHVPVRSFAQMTVGFFLEDSNMALVQTPHHFFNPDPFERNLLTEGEVPPEQEFFYHVILLGDDFWNSVFFCGSCALLKRSALEEIGGIAVETITEDAHTGLKLHAAGYNSAYLEIPQAAGLATERYSQHVVQRMRWAQGMTQILRLDNPLFKLGLSLPQRLNYFNSMIHFLFGTPRLIYIVAPLVYLLFGLHPLEGDPIEIMAYALPHIFLAWITNSIVYKGFRHSFWAEVYETALAWATAKVTLTTLVRPHGAKFNVTAKGSGTLEKTEFDRETARPNMVLLGLSLLGLAVAPLRFMFYPAEVNTILLNCGWTVFNLLMLSAALFVALEQVQERISHRVNRVLEAEVQVAGGRWAAVETVDISESGCRLKMDPELEIPTHTRVRLFGRQGVEVMLSASVIHGVDHGHMVEAGFTFERVNPRQQEALKEIVFGAADSWIDFTSPVDSVGGGFLDVIKTPYRVITGTLSRRRSRLQAERMEART